MPLGCSWPVVLFGSWTQPELLGAQGGGICACPGLAPSYLAQETHNPSSPGFPRHSANTNTRCHPGVPSRESRAPPMGGPPPGRGTQPCP